MKTLKITEATGPLKDYAKHLEGRPLIVTQKGQPVVALVPIEGVDLESLSLSTNPDFIALIEHSREEHRAGRTISAEEMWRRLGLER